jgi:hypothetical protein
MRTPTPGLEHLGHLSGTSEEFVAAVLPRVRSTLAAGGRVSAVVERRTRRALVEALGADVAIDFPTAGALRTAPSDGFLAHVRDTATPAGGLVLAQYSVFDLADTDLRAGEEEVNRLPADLPVTLVCACAHDARDARVTTLRATHPRLLHADGIRVNPGFHGVADPLVLPRPDDVRVLSVAVRGTVDLHSLRVGVEAAARAAGLAEDDVHRAVIAVHEAAVVVGSAVWPGRVACAVQVWAGVRSLAAEVRGPKPAGPDVGTATDRLPRHPGRRPGLLDHVRLFCRAAVVDDGDEVRTIRLVTG